MRQRRGFTLLELMVVIGVLLLLVTIAVAAYNKIVNSMAAKATNTALENAQSILAEYEQAISLSSMGYLSPGNADPDFPYLGGNNVNATNGDPTLPIGPIGSVGTGGAERYPGSNQYQPVSQSQGLPSGRWAYNTAAVMMTMMKIPSVAQQINKITSKSLLTNHGQPITLEVNGVSNNPAPLLVDGWNNTIIFVPASGLITNLNIGQIDPATRKPKSVQVLVRTSGLVNPYTGQRVLLKATDRPFWASAGPDGDLSLGDDNIYSFKQ